jgi:hypothetical protein
MHTDAFTVFICVLVLATGFAIWLRHCLSERRRRARQAEWEQLMRHCQDLDRELDRIWCGR